MLPRPFDRLNALCAVARRIRTIFLVALSTCYISQALALDYQSLARPAVMYDAPSTQAQPLYIINAGTPVEAVVSLENFTKVRDSEGTLAWVEKSALTDQRTVIVRVQRATIFSMPDEKSAVAFAAQKNVLLNWIEDGPPGWVHVHHRDGQSGYIRLTDVWGA